MIKKLLPLFILPMLGVIEPITPQVLAQAAPAGVPQPSLGEVFMQMLPMFSIVFFIFYFLVIRPQNKKLLEHETLLKNLKKGDEVVAASGLIGKVFLIEPAAITIEIAPNVRVKVLPNTVQTKIVEAKPS